MFKKWDQFKILIDFVNIYLQQSFDWIKQSRETLLWEARWASLGLDTNRQQICPKSDKKFLGENNNKKTKQKQQQQSGEPALDLTLTTKKVAKKETFCIVI